MSEVTRRRVGGRGCICGLVSERGPGIIMKVKQIITNEGKSYGYSHHQIIMQTINIACINNKLASMSKVPMSKHIQEIRF